MLSNLLLIQETPKRALYDSIRAARGIRTLNGLQVCTETFLFHSKPAVQTQVCLQLLMHTGFCAICNGKERYFLSFFSQPANKGIHTTNITSSNKLNSKKKVRILSTLETSLTNNINIKTISLGHLSAKKVLEVLYLLGLAPTIP